MSTSNVYLRANSPYFLIDYIHPITGKRIRRTSKTTVKEKAVEMYAKEYAEAFNQKNHLGTTNKTVRELIDWCWDNYWGLKQGANKHDRYLAIKVFLDRFANEKAEALTADMLREFMRDRIQTVKKRSVQLEFTHVSCAYNQGIKNGLLKSNPFKQIDAKLFREGMNGKKGRDRTATMEEVELLLGHSAGILQKIIEFDLNSGLRKGQIENLKWSDIDFVKKTMTVCSGKGGEFHTYKVPIFDRALEILKSLPHDGDYVFTNQVGGRIPSDGLIHSGFPRLVDRLQIRDFTFHDLRHTFATAFYRKSKDLKRIQQILGHSNTKTTEIYLNLTDADLAQGGSFRFDSVWHTSAIVNSEIHEQTSKILENQHLGL